MRSDHTLSETIWGNRSFPEWSGMERRRACAPRGNGTLERPGAGRRSGMQRSAGKVRLGGRETIEPEVVPAEPAETGRPEAEQRSTTKAEAVAGRHGCCAASVPILSLRRFGGSERS